MKKKYSLSENDPAFIDNVHFLICQYTDDISYCHNSKLYLWLFLFLKYGLKTLYVRGFCASGDEYNWWIHSLGTTTSTLPYNDENRTDFVY